MDLRTQFCCLVASGLILSHALSAETTREFTEVRATAPGKTLSVDTISADLTVTTGHDNEVVLDFVYIADTNNQEDANEIFENVELSIREDGDGVEVKIEPVKEKTGWFSWGDTKMPRIRITARVPRDQDIHFHSTSGTLDVAGVYGNHTADVTSGDVRIRDANADVRVDSISGDVELENITGAIHIDSTSGDLKVLNGSGSLHMDSTSGNVRAEEFSGPVSVDSTSGSVHVSFMAAPREECVFDAVSGSVRLYLPAETAMNVKAGTVSGGIRCELNITEVEVEKRNQLRAKINGGGPDLRIETVSGSIHILPR